MKAGVVVLFLTSILIVGVCGLSRKFHPSEVNKIKIAEKSGVPYRNFKKYNSQISYKPNYRRPIISREDALALRAERKRNLPQPSVSIPSSFPPLLIKESSPNTYSNYPTGKPSRHRDYQRNRPVKHSTYVQPGPTPQYYRRRERIVYHPRRIHNERYHAYESFHHPPGRPDVHSERNIGYHYPRHHRNRLDHPTPPPYRADWHRQERNYYGGKLIKRRRGHFTGGYRGYIPTSAPRTVTAPTPPGLLMRMMEDVDLM